MLPNVFLFLSVTISLSTLSPSICVFISLHSNLFLSFSPLSLAVCLGAHGRYAQKLLTDLFSNYTNALRPVEDTDHIINVTLQITLSQIIDMVTTKYIFVFYYMIPIFFFNFFCKLFFVNVFGEYLINL